ncbi:OmpA family protein [Spirosoma sp.]|uniref:OmpA family protein n=1 Tax=Spirosoma sp. TaxID=1899569 RepID=UPI002620789B|nr:OmpA family protein [Spirosoma sp.]MCX6214608.1 OmpA family protein [Spirosoma sp.]
MKPTQLLVFFLIWISAHTAPAQAPSASRHSELDDVIKELETNGYEAVKDKKLRLRTIHYVSGTSQLTPGDKQYLDTIATFLTRMPTVVMEIGGHTDNVGDKQANVKLSQERAASTMRYVISKGILTSRIRAVGYGSTQAIADNKTEEGRAQNRRVEMKFIGLTSDVYNLTTKSGRKIAATYVVVSADGRTISYRQNAGAPLMKVPVSGIDYIEYPDGSRRRPDAIVLSGSGNGGDTRSPAESREVKQTVVEPTARVESTGTVRSIIKYAPLSNFGYEHVLNNKHSLYGSISLYSLGLGVTALGLKGEYRFYGLIKDSPKSAPEGFWVAPTVLYWQLSDRALDGYVDRLSIVQLGGIAGYQWIFNKKISLEPALGLSLTAVGVDSDYSLGAGFLPLFALRVGYVLK